MVTVSDGKFSDRAPVVICLHGGNKWPYFVGDPYVREDLPAGSANHTVVLTVQARDDDLQGQIVYEVSNCCDLLYIRMK